MDKTDRQKLIEENQKLMALRQERGIKTDAGPTPIATPAAAVAERGGMTLADYWEMLAREGEGTINGSSTSLTSREIWESFNSDRHPALVRAVKVIKTWYNERLGPGGALVLAGGTGCGKTHLARAIHQLYGFRSLYWEECALFEAIKASYNGYSRLSEAEIFGRIRKADLLVYDDLGAYETDNLAWIQNIYRVIFHDRIDQAGKATLFTTNLKASAIADRIGGRNFDRLLGALDTPEFYVNLFEVPSYRSRNFARMNYIRHRETGD